MKILHCLDHFLPDQLAGTEVYTWALCKGLQSKNIIVEVAIPNYGKSETTQYDYDGITVYKFGEPSTVDRELIMGFRIAEGVEYFKKLLDKIKPDIVHFHELAGSNGITLQHVIAAKNMNIKTLMTFHLAHYSCKTGTLMYKDHFLCDGIIDEIRCSKCIYSIQTSSPLFAESLMGLAKFFYKLNIDLSKSNSKIGTAIGFPFVIKKLRKDLFTLSDNLDKIVVLTRWYQKVLIDNAINKDKISIIQQALVPQSSVATQHTEQLKIDKKLNLVFFGRINKFKGVHLILEAVAGLAQTSFNLDFYGLDPDDSYSKKCREQINQLDNVVWKGWLEPEMVVSTMKNYDALILASTFSEMSPLVIQEAFAAGIPIIASDVYGNAEQVQHETNGFLFQYNNSSSLKNLLQDLIDHPDKIIKAKNNIKRPEIFENVTKCYIHVYEEILIK